jgi:tRNA threonylcarbamoyladenosine biosynthesis protein TsaB
VKILALDTATEACSAALWVDGQLIGREMEFERGHAEHILPMIDGLLAEGGVALGALDALAFGRGPGGFTGVRLAASVTQGLAFAAGLRVVAISDLAAVAQRAFDAEPSVTRMLVCSDARMKEVYWACYERDATGLANAVGVERVSPADAVEVWSGWRPDAIGAAGRGFRAYPELRSRLVDSENGIRLVSDSFLPRAHEIARLAAPEVRAGRTIGAEEAIPVYLRDDVARPRPS